MWSYTPKHPVQKCPGPSFCRVDLFAQHSEDLTNLVDTGGDTDLGEQKCILIDERLDWKKRNTGSSRGSWEMRSLSLYMSWKIAKSQNEKWWIVGIYGLTRLADGGIFDEMPWSFDDLCKCRPCILLQLFSPDPTVVPVWSCIINDPEVACYTLSGFVLLRIPRLHALYIIRYHK